MIATILVALGLVLILEGLVYALAPSFIEDLLKAMSQLSLTKRRQVGWLVIALGIVCLVAANWLT